MRLLKFRGIPLDDDCDIMWLYGNVIMNYKDKLAYIESPGHGIFPVKWESVGQYIGIKDSTPWNNLIQKEQEEWLKTEGNTPDNWVGKEIYEGDLLEHDMEVDGIWETYEAFEVIYNEKEAMFNFRDDGDTSLNCYRNLVVVGNVHEEIRKSA